MLRLNKSDSGLMLISVLMLSVMLVMLTVSMITLISESTNITGRLDKKIKSLKAAEAGVEYALYQLNSNPSWGDPSVDPNYLNDITESIGNGEEFTIIFDTGKNPHSINNLKNSLPNPPAPPYSAEIICEGVYERDGIVEGTTKIKALFVRDDLMPYPLTAEGDIYISVERSSFSSGIVQINGKNITDPGRIHSNDDLDILGFGGPTMLLDNGFLSACGAVTITSVTGPLPKKDQTDEIVPVKIPSIDVSAMVAAASLDPNIHTLPSDTFYVLGYFEYDGKDPNNPGDFDDPTDPNDDPGDAYCVPHSQKNPNGTTDKLVHTNPFRLGIISFQETSCDNFVRNYGECYWDGPPPMSYSNDDLYGYYPAIRFWEYGSPGFSSIENELAMNVTKTADPNNPSIDLITLTLQKDLFIQTTNGLFMTEWGCRASRPPDYVLSTFSNTKVDLNLNNKTIYGNKLWLQIPPSGTGAIVSNETIDIHHAYTVDMVALSEKSVRIIYDEPSNQTNAIITYNGIIYGRDDILIQAQSSWNSGKKLFFNGRMVCSDETSGNCTGSPLANSIPMLDYSPPGNLNLFIESVVTKEINILLGDQGMPELVALRGNNFQVRKKFYEIIR